MRDVSTLSAAANRASWHLLTCEYPPQIGGVGDYTQLVAEGLARAGDEVHVWCPSVNGASRKGTAIQTASLERVSVHREFGKFSPADLSAVNRQLDQFASQRRLLVQWVPHGYGYRSMNLPFCLWLWRRAKRCGDQIELVVHEPFLAFGQGSRKQDGAALVHRLMALILLRSARRVWVTIPDWERCLRPYSKGEQLNFAYVPVPSNVPVICDREGVQQIRQRYLKQGRFLIGHFGTHGREVAKLLMSSLPAVLTKSEDRVVLLMGQGSQQFRERFIAAHPDFEDRIQASGPLETSDLSRHLSACDLAFQPYPDGINGRHGAAMAGLAHGLPMVTTSGHLTESFWKDSHAVAIAAIDEKAIVSLVESLLANANERERLSRAALALYEQRFDVKNTIQALRNGNRLAK